MAAKKRFAMATGTKIIAHQRAALMHVTMERSFSEVLTGP